jgi:pimeloyl-ACP methyl ester carboxylesterase
MERALLAAGFDVVNFGYPSRSGTVEELAETWIPRALALCTPDTETVHFVAHSLGGILVRQYLSRHTIPHLGRMVMLGPPNRGSEVVDRIGHWPGFHGVNGPAGRQLGTGPDAIPSRLGPVAFPVGVIAGRLTINWINSLMIPGPDDGKVSVERTKVDGMTDHLVLNTSHPFIMRNPHAIAQTIHFLREGRFAHSV